MSFYNNISFTSCKTALNVGNIKDIFYASINPYLGCTHQCVYCYVQAEKYSKGKDVFFTYVKHNIIDILIKELSKYTIKYQKGIIYLGTSSDPYQPLEQQFKLSHKILSIIFNNTSYNVHIFTKSKNILDDIELFTKFKNRVNISITITTIDEKIKNIFEPNSHSVKERLECIKKLNLNEITTGCAMMPILPFITDNETHIEQLIFQLKQFKCKYIWWDYLTLRNNITNSTKLSQKQKFYEILSTNFPHLLNKYLLLYNNKILPTLKYQNFINRKIIKIIRKYNLSYFSPKFSLFDESYHRLF
ncbi:MAG: radical SAM protein [Endomicrobia bacterium]|nr:radical SAM protein [Endomicrobiia bacterium]